MKKVINITIGGIVFSVEEDAYQKLDNYLSQIKLHFAKLEDESEEIVSDIETSIAEKFSQRGRTAQSAITISDVDSVISELGTVEDLSRFEEGASDFGNKKEKQFPRRLYRDEDDVIIAGVASGIAKYFGIDPIIIRLLFAVSVFFGGFGIALYLIFWIIVPVANTPIKKIEMQGGSATISEIESFVKEKVEEVKKKDTGTVKKILTFPFLVLKTVFDFIKKFIKVLIPIVRVFAGLILTIGGFIAIFAFSTVLFIALSDASIVDPATKILVDFFTKDVGGYFVTAAFYFLVAIPLLLIFFSGLSLLRKKKTIGFLGGIVLFFTWLLSVSIVTATGITHYEEIQERVDQIVEIELGETKTQNYPDIKEFTELSIRGGYTVHIQKGDVREVTVTAPEKLLEELVVTSENGELSIYRDAPPRVCLFVCSSFFADSQIIITTPHIEKIIFSGSVDGTMDEFQTNDFEAVLSGSSRFVINMQAQDMDIRAYGSSRLKLLGKADNLFLHLSGSSKISGYEFIAKKAYIDASGSSRIYLAVEELLDADLSGSNTIRYIGENTEVLESISGSGNIYKVSPEEAVFDDSFEDLLIPNITIEEVQPITPIAPVDTL